MANGSMIRAVNDDWYTDDLPLACDSQKTIELTMGRWIIEVSDLNGFRKADVEHLKAQLSKTKDCARMAFGHYRLDRERQFIFMGTAVSRRLFNRGRSGGV